MPTMLSKPRAIAPANMTNPSRSTHFLAMQAPEAGANITRVTAEVILMRRKIRFLTWLVLALLIPWGMAAATLAKEETVTLEISGMT